MSYDQSAKNFLSSCGIETDSGFVAYFEIEPGELVPFAYVPSSAPPEAFTTFRVHLVSVESGVIFQCLNSSWS